MLEEEDIEYGHESDIYQLFFHMEFEWPCLSFDVIPDPSKGTIQTQFPMEATFVSATQAANDEQNQLIVTHVSNLQSTHDDDTKEESALQNPNIQCVGNQSETVCNRIRINPQNTSQVALYGEDDNVRIYDISSAITASRAQSNAPVVLENVLQLPPGSASYGIAWNPHVSGQLAVGLDDGTLTLWDVSTSNCFISFQAHSASIEDICFSPKEATFLATCSCDGLIRVWDISHNPPIMVREFHLVTESNVDVNCISWNENNSSLLLSGHDDGTIAVWSLSIEQDPSNPSTLEPVFIEKEYHHDPITSVEWDPNDETSFAVSSEDGRVTVWDISVEKDENEEEQNEFPDQLMFEHVTEDPKELHYNRQVKGMIAVTGGSFDVFIPDIQDLPDEAPDANPEKAEA